MWNIIYDWESLSDILKGPSVQTVKPPPTVLDLEDLRHLPCSHTRAGTQLTAVISNCKQLPMCGYFFLSMCGYIQVSDYNKTDLQYFPSQVYIAVYII